MTENHEEQISREALLQALGEQLRETRKFKKMSVEEVATTLKFSNNQVKALEAGDWSQLPDDVYALGFLRQYARLLRLDVSDEIAQLKSDMTLRQPWTIPDPAVAPSRRWAWLVLLLAIAGLVYVNLWQDDTGKSGGSPAVTAPGIEKQAPADEKQAPADKTQQDTDATAEAVQNSETPAATAGSDTAAASADENAAAPPTKEEPATTPAPEAGAADMAAAATTAAEPGRHQLLLAASGGDVWLQVHAVDSQGNRKKLKETLLRDGQQLLLQSDASTLLLTAGNAMALGVSIDGRERYTVGSLGRNGKVLRDFSLPLAAE